MHVKAGSGNNGGGEAGKVNGIATEQGYYALVAYQRMKNGQTSLYDMSDVKLKKGGNVCTSVSAETAGRTKTEAEIARTEENAEVLLEGKIVKAPLVGIFYASPEEGGTPFVQKNQDLFDFSF